MPLCSVLWPGCYVVGSDLCSKDQTWLDLVGRGGVSPGTGTGPLKFDRNYNIKTKTKIYSQRPCKSSLLTHKSWAPAEFRRSDDRGERNKRESSGCNLRNTVFVSSYVEVF